MYRDPSPGVGVVKEMFSMLLSGVVVGVGLGFVKYSHRLTNTPRVALNGFLNGSQSEASETDIPAGGDCGIGVGIAQLGLLLTIIHTNSGPHASASSNSHPDDTGCSFGTQHLAPETYRSFGLHSLALSTFPCPSGQTLSRSCAKQRFSVSNPPDGPEIQAVSVPLNLHRKAFKFVLLCVPDVGAGAEGFFGKHSAP